MDAVIEKWEEILQTVKSEYEVSLLIPGSSR